jgi:hypothetical protein
MCVVVSPQKPLNLMIYQAKVSLLMPCMDLGFRVQGLELGALDLRHKKSNQFQALYIYIYIYIYEMCGSPLENKQGMCHIAPLPFTLKSILTQTKEELWKPEYFILQKYNLQKNPLKETKILQDIITLITNLKFQHNKSKYHLSKILL